MTTNRKIQLGSIVLVLAALLFTSFISGGGDEGYTTVRTIEIANGMWDSKICIVYDNGKEEEIVLEKFKSSTFNPNTKKINEVLNNMIKKGYTLVSASSGNGDAVITNTFIFKR